MDEKKALVNVRKPTSLNTMTLTSVFDQLIYVPYVPTSLETAKKMLEIAGVGPKDIVYDLGCGDARLLFLAIELFKAKKAVGYEIRKEIYKKAQEKVHRQNLKDKVTILNRDLFEGDLSKATVITIYLTNRANKKLKPKLEKEAKTNTRIVSHDFKIPGWQPTHKQKYHSTTIYLYTIPYSYKSDKS